MEMDKLAHEASIERAALVIASNNRQPPKPFELVDEHLAAVEAEDVAMNDSFVSEEDIYRGRY